MTAWRSRWAARSACQPCLRVDSPQVLLLQEGINDLSDQGLGGIGALVDALTNMVMEARGNGVQHVFLATLLPARDGARATNTELIPSMNDDIKLVAGNTGATLVDLYAAFGGTADPAYIGNDGLHPTALGYQLIAQTFLNAIEATVEAPPTAALTSNAPKVFARPRPLAQALKPIRNHSPGRASLRLFQSKRRAEHRVQAAQVAIAEPPPLSFVDGGHRAVAHGHAFLAGLEFQILKRTAAP